jgi:sugar phosphate isomerase/epimerase
MKFRNVVNDASTNPPRLRLQQAIWAMIDLPRGSHEWSLAEKFDRAKEAGFSAIEAYCLDDAFADSASALAHEKGLPIAMIMPASTVDELLPGIERAHRMRAEYLGLHVHGSLRATPEIADTLAEMYEIANDAGLPLFIETHRATVTQDLRRAVKVLNRFKKLRFIGDFSHYIVSGEIKDTWSEDVWHHFEQIAKKVSAWHGRIGYGQQVQNDIGDGTNALCQQFKKLWTIGMTAWLSKAQRGDILPFTAELGPAPYSITDLNGQEISDRWQQALVMKRLAEEAWSEAQAAHQAAPTVPADTTATE